MSGMLSTLRIRRHLAAGPGAGAVVLACSMAVFSVAPAHAESLPKWEVGFGAAGLTMPDYRGSDERTDLLLPLPYLVYRGERVQADRNGLRTRLFDSERVEASLSLNGTLPAPSSRNRARAGMTDLKPIVEVGGNLGVRLWEGMAQRARLDLRLPLRSALTVQRAPRAIGLVFSPNLDLKLRDPDGFSGWRVGLQGGPLFASRRYNAYFYSVGPEAATLSRPAYDAPGGYAGSQITFTLSKRYAHAWVGSFLRYDSVAGAVFADSPLVRRRGGLSGGFGVAWVFGQSAQRVDARE